MTGLPAAIAALALLAPAGAASAPTPAWQPPTPSPAVQAAMKSAEAGDPAALTKLADGGDADAQYLAGVLYLFGGAKIAKDPARGCAFEEKASARRADAMHLVGMCHQTGAAGAVDKAKAEAAFGKASEMGFPQSKCALGQMLMAEPARAKQGLSLCQEAARAGDADAQMTVGNAYFAGTVGKPNRAESRKWYEMAARQGKADANRRLGEMYAQGDGGRKDSRKAMQYWTAAEKAGDPLVSILVADHLFANISGGKKPGPGTYGFKGGVPVADLQVIEEWYQQALERDPRPDVKERARYALAIVGSLKQGAVSASTATTKKR